jgi:hypothetical protein
VKKILLTHGQLVARAALIFFGVAVLGSILLIALVEYLLERNLP